jgi:hypothetical protein
MQHTNITPPYTLNICNTSIGEKLRYKYAKKVNTSFCTFRLPPTRAAKGSCPLNVRDCQVLYASNKVL